MLDIYLNLHGSLFWLLPGAVALIIFLLFLLLAQMGIGTPEAIRTFQSALRSHGYAEDSGGWLGKFESQLPSGLSKSLSSAGLNRALLVVNSPYSANQFIIRSIGIGLIFFALALGVDGLGFLEPAKTWILNPILTVLVCIVMIFLQISRAQRQARDMAKRIDNIVLTLMPTLAAVLASPGVAASDALRELAAGSDDPALYNILHNDNWRTLLPSVPLSASIPETYIALGRFYGSPSFLRLGEGMESARSSNLQEGAAVTQVAALLYTNRMTETKQRAMTNKLAASITTVFMLLILLSILGYPLFTKLNTL